MMFQTDWAIVVKVIEKLFSLSGDLNVNFFSIHLK